jgi:hypothetical protein
MNDDTERRPEEILADIERKRTDLDDTLQAIERRLTPGQLVDQGLDYLRRNNARAFASNLGASVRDNPLPVALVGIGLAWLMATNGRDARRGGPRASAFDDDGEMLPMASADDREGLGERLGDAKDRVADGAHAAKERAADAMHAAKDRVRGTVDRAALAARATRERLRDTTSSARARAGELRDGVRHQVDRARDGYDYVLREQPLALGAVGLALGAVLAATLPRSRQEDRLMGPVRDRLADDAADTAREQMDKVRRVADTARDAAEDEWHAQQAQEPPQAPRTDVEPVPPALVRPVPTGPH